VQIADVSIHRALAYVDAVSRHGYVLNVSEFTAYASLPTRKTSSRIGDALAVQIQRSALALALGGERESILEWLVRLGWLRSVGIRVLMTPLGRAVLAALEEAGRDEDIPTELVLDPSDELSYARLIGTIASAGEAALVDGYFTINSLLDIVQRTQITRILVRPDHTNKGRIEALAQAVNDLRIEKPFEIRVGDEIHDRFVIPADGNVRFIGTSLNGVGRRIALTGQLDDAASGAIRSLFETAWGKAAVVAATEPASIESETAEETTGLAIATAVTSDAPAGNGTSTPAVPDADAPEAAGGTSPTE
jgi:hypothetical protein